MMRATTATSCDSLTKRRLDQMSLRAKISLLLVIALCTLFGGRLYSQQGQTITVTGGLYNQSGLSVEGDVTVVQGVSDRTVTNYRTDPSGYYEITALPIGQPALVVAKAPGLLSESRSISGTEDEEIDFTLEEPIQVSGQVLSDQGTPLAGALVRVQYPDRTPQPFQFTQELGNGITNNLGEFVLEFVRPQDRFFVEAKATGYKAAQGSALYATGVPIADLRLQLAAGATISGQVVSRDGRGLGSVTVTLKAAGSTSLTTPVRPFRTRTSETGFFSFTGLENAQYTITAQRAGSAPQQQIVNVSSSTDQHTLAIVLP